MKLGSIGIICKDIQSSIKFYSILGLKFKQFKESDHYECILTNNLTLMLDSEDLIKSIQPKWEAGTKSKISLCFEFSEPESVNHTYKKLIDLGYKSVKKPWNAFWNQRYATILDPDNNQIDLYCDLPLLKNME